MSREPDLGAVNRALSVTVQKQQREIAMLRRALLEAADKLEGAGGRQSGEMARDAAAETCLAPPTQAAPPALPQPFIALAAALSSSPCGLILGGHPLAEIDPNGWRDGLDDSEPKLHPEGRPLRHQERASPEAGENHHGRNGLLPGH